MMLRMRLTLCRSTAARGAVGCRGLFGRHANGLSGPDEAVAIPRL